MSLRRKTLIIIGVMLLGLTVFLYFASRIFLFGSVSQLENQNVNNNMDRTVNVITDELSSLDSLTVDWAQWDDTYQFVQDNNQAYITSNLFNDQFISLKLNLMMFFDTSGQVVFSKAFDLQTKQIALPPAELGPHLSANSPFLSYASDLNSVTGILNTAAGPLLVVSRPILTSNQTGPRHGILIFGRYLNEAKVNQLAATLHLSLKVFQVNDPRLPADFSAAQSALSVQTPVFIQPLDGNTIAGYIAFNDVYGQPAVLLRADMPRDFLKVSQNNISYFLAFLVVVALALGTILTSGLERIILSRLTSLSDDVNAISSSRDVATRLKESVGNDELSLLALNINRMLENLEHSQETVLESNQRLRTVVNNAPIVIWAADNDGKFTLLEGAGLTALGTDPERRAWQTISDWNRRALAGDTAVSAIHLGNMEFETRATSLRDGKGKIVGVIGVATDITERRLAEVAMRQSEEKFRQMFELAPNGMAIMDADGQMLRVNQSFCELVGYFPEEMPMPRLQNVTYPSDLSATIRLLRSLINDERATFQSEVRFIASDRRIVNTILQASLIPTSADTEPFILIQIVDITERKLAEEALRQSEERFRSLVESARDYIYLINLGSEILQTNSASIMDSGYTEDELIGHSLVEFLTPRSRSVFPEQFAQLLLDGSSRQEIEFVRKNGSVIVMDFSGSVIYNDQGHPINVTVLQRDITQRKRMEDALQQALQKEKELSDLKTRFVSIASHEFRTPLATISAATDTLTAYWSRLDASEVVERLETVQAQVARMTDLMDDVLIMARMQAGKVGFKPITSDMDRFCRMILNEFKGRPDITHQFVYRCEQPPIPALIDEKLMRTIFSNLLTNAVKYSPTNSTVFVDLSHDATHITLSVRDQGIGIPEADQKHLFESFHRATNVGTISGTGLGLSITKQAVETHGGTIVCNSQVGEGTSFVVTIPAFETGDDSHDENTRDRRRISAS